MPTPVFPTAPFFSELRYVTPYGVHIQTSYFGTLVPSVTGDPSGHDYGYGASAGLGWQTRYSDFVTAFAKASGSTTLLDTLTLYANPNPGVVTPIPVYSDNVSSLGTALGIAVESSEDTYTWADAANKKMKVVVMDSPYPPPQKHAIATAGGSAGALFRTAILVEQTVTTRHFTAVTRALTESVKFNRRFMRKRGQ